MRMTLTTRQVAGLALGAALALASGSAQARYVSVKDGFESGNAGNWAASGGIALQAGNPKAPAHTGGTFLRIINPNAGPGTSLTNQITVNANKGDRCTLQVWVRGQSKTGTLAITAKSGFMTGETLGQRTISMPSATGSRKSNFYAPYRINFRHGGAPFFVSIDAFGPIDTAIDDFSLTCRTK
jgi:hypothetical protein